jgi:hypothetical protein
MKLLETIDDILDQEDKILPAVPDVELDFTFEEQLFEKIANFIINLDPDTLSDDQVLQVLEMLDELEVEDVDEVRKVSRFARRTPQSKNQYSKKWYRKNRTAIKRRKAKFRRSAQGRKRLKAKERLERTGRTATGRKKVKYHRRKRSKRYEDDRENR